MLHLWEGDWGRYWLCSCILTVTQFCWRLLGALAEILVSHLLRHSSCSGDKLPAAVLSSIALPVSPCAQGITLCSSPLWMVNAMYPCGCAHSLRWMKGGWKRGNVHVLQNAEKAAWLLRKWHYGKARKKQGSGIGLFSRSENTHRSWKLITPLFPQGTKPRWKLWAEMYKVSFLQSAFILLAQGQIVPWGPDLQVYPYGEIFMCWEHHSSQQDAVRAQKLARSKQQFEKCFVFLQGKRHTINLSNNSFNKKTIVLVLLIAKCKGRPKAALFSVYQKFFITLQQVGEILSGTLS